MRKEETSNIAFELTDGVDFVNHLSLLCNCVMICLNIRSLSKTTLNVHIHTSVSFTRSCSNKVKVRWKILFVSYPQMVSGYDAKIIKIG